MKLTSLALVLALLPAALFAAGGNSGTTNTPAAPIVIPGGAFTTTYVISASGSYVLGGNRSTPSSVYAIQVAAPDVTLDLNGFTLSNTGSATTTGGGVDIPTPENVEIPMVQSPTRATLASAPLPGKVSGSSTCASWERDGAVFTAGRPGR